VYEEPIAGWEIVSVHNEGDDEWTDRLEVPGGWLYRCHRSYELPDGAVMQAMSTSFVPYLEP